MRPDDRADSMRGEKPPIYPWETGKPNGRGLYERRGRYGNNLMYIGIMDEHEVAAHIVSLHNRLAEGKP